MKFYNLQPFFWRKVKNIIRQNKKAALQEFLFGSQDSIPAPETQNHLNEKIETLQNQANSLQDRIRDLETTLENSNDALSRTLKASQRPLEAPFSHFQEVISIIIYHQIKRKPKIA